MWNKKLLIYGKVLVKKNASKMISTIPKRLKAIVWRRGQTHNKIWLLRVLNKQNVNIDIFLKEAHFYDKIINHFGIFSFSRNILYADFFSKDAKWKKHRRDE